DFVDAAEASASSGSRGSTAAVAAVPGSGAGAVPLTGVLAAALFAAGAAYEWRRQGGGPRGGRGGGWVRLARPGAPRFAVPEALPVPVLVAALLCLAAVLVEFGRCLIEMVGRRGRSYAVLQDATERAIQALGTKGDVRGATAALDRISTGPEMSDAITRIVSQ